MGNIDLANFVFAEKSVPMLNFIDYNLTIAGRRGAGKSTLAIEFFRDVCCIVDLEDGNKQVDDVYKIRPKSWKELKSIQTGWDKAIKSGQQCPFSVLLFDTQTKLSMMCDEYVLKQNGWEDFNQPKGENTNRWNVRKNEYDKVMNKFKDLGFKIVYICHGKDKETKLRGQEGYKQFAADVSGSFDYTVLGEVDFIFYLEKIRVKDDDGNTKEVRRLVMQNDIDYDVKCRFPELPDEIIYEDAADGVRQFMNAWDQAVMKRKANKMNKEEATLTFIAKSEPEQVLVTTPKTENEQPKSEPVIEYDNDDIGTEVETKEDIKEAVVDDGKDLAYWQKEAKGIRTKLKESMELDEVKKIMKEEIGTFKVADATDVTKLKAFVEKYK